MTASQHKSILIAEDSPEDFELIKIALEENNFQGEIEWFKNGEELLEFLNDSEKFNMKKASQNFITLLDINMPKKNGFEALEVIKNHPALKVMPCILFTTSQSEEDVQKGYDLGANSFLTKPIDFNSMIELFKSIKEYWLTNTVLPKITSV